MKRYLCQVHWCPLCHGSTPQFARIFDDDGQDLIEYALLAAVLSVGFVVMLQALVNGVIPFFDQVVSALESA